MNTGQIEGLMDLLGVSREEEQSASTLPTNVVQNAKGQGKKSQAPPNMKVVVTRLQYS